MASLLLSLPELFGLFSQIFTVRNWWGSWRERLRNDVDPPMIVAQGVSNSYASQPPGIHHIY